jgi:hypothetical protein
MSSMLLRHIFVVFGLSVISALPSVARIGALPAATPTRTNASVSSINLSRDLVRLGIAPRNLSPNDKSLDARPLFEAAVKYAQKHASRLLTVDQGAYYFLSPQDARAYLRIAKASDLTIDLADSTIYLANALQQGFALFDCHRVTLTNFSIDFQVLPYTHVRLASVDPRGRTLTYNVLPNWADPVTLNGATFLSKPLELWAVAFRNGDIVPGTSRMPVAEPITRGALQLAPDPAPWTQRGVLSTLKSDDTIIVTQREGPSAILVVGGDFVTVSNATVYGASSIAVLLTSTSHSTVDHVRVTPKPGVGLISANADGIHINTAGPDNHVRHCFISHTMDDAIAIDSLDIARVQRQSGRRLVTVNRRAYLRFPNGTAVNFVDPVSAEELPGSTIISQEPPDSSPPVFGGSATLTFDRDLPALGPDFGMTFADAKQRGAGSSVENNVVEAVPFGRGIWIGGAEGVTIGRNEIGPTSDGGIVVSQDTKMFAGPPAHDISIRGNRVVGSLGPMASGAGTHTALGAIIVESKGQSWEFASGVPNTNIAIEGNYISGSGRSGIWVGELNTGSIRDNCIIHWNQHPELPVFGVPPQQGLQLSQQFTHPVVVRNSRNVQTIGNSTEWTPACKLLKDALSATP